MLFPVTAAGQSSTQSRERLALGPVFPGTIADFYCRTENLHKNSYHNSNKFVWVKRLPRKLLLHSGLARAWLTKMAGEAVSPLTAHGRSARGPREEHQWHD